MVVEKGTRAGGSKVELVGLLLSVAISDCRNVAHMAAVVGEGLERVIGTSKESSSFVVAVRMTELCKRPGAGLLMVGMQLVCKVGKQRWGYC